ncbi:type IV pilus assembly protein PilV [Chiayiivirga flava]|uniref:Type IV pilus assembly protein PilV n=1 Tax=Chiayiivirga flava TaxID=659595 RepID=A0A7W8FZH7_9GAMM|nr:type IV pilus assembly protein PilV [Chiayiivirga flava]
MNVSARVQGADAGFSLIEVMVAVLVLSLGLLGMAALQGVSMRYNQSANYRTQATNLAYEFIDTARSYSDRDLSNLVALVQNFTDWSQMCEIGTPPGYACGSSADALNCDRERWAQKICRTMPNGRGQVLLDTSLAAPQITVRLCWNDDRGLDPAVTSDCSDPSEALGGQPFAITSQL